MGTNRKSQSTSIMNTAVVRKVERKAGQARREGSVRTFRGRFKTSVNRCIHCQKADDHCSSTSRFEDQGEGHSDTPNLAKYQPAPEYHKLGPREQAPAPPLDQRQPPLHVERAPDEENSVLQD